MRRLHISIALLSAAIIAFQLLLIQVLSVIQWYHFAYMVISVALLGFGAAGTTLALAGRRLTSHIELVLPVLMMITSIAMALVVGILQSPYARFDSYLLFTEYSQVGRLLVTYFLFFIPFFFGALAIGLVFVKQVAEIGRLYFVNLLGSGLGGLLALGLIQRFFPNQSPAFVAILPLVAGLIILPKNKSIFYVILLFVPVSIISWKIYKPPQLKLSQFKDISKTLLLPGAKVELTKTSPYGVIEAVSSPALRYAPGLSLTAGKTARVKMAMYINGDWVDVVTDWKRGDTASILDFTTAALPYVIKDRNAVLVLKPGAGINVADALTRPVKNITVVEPNSAILSILENEFAATTDSLYFQKGITVHNLEARTFLLTDTAHYDLVTMPLLGTFGGASGVSALQEQFMLTKEAFHDMWMRLYPGGAISVTCWMDYPVRYPLKMLATLVEMLHDARVEDPRNHIAAIRSWGTITFVITRLPLQQPDIKNIRMFCDTMMFDPAILPGLREEERTIYNQFQDDMFFKYIDRIMSGDREIFYQDYDFNIKPATDNQPYFSQFIKWKNLSRLGNFFGNRSIPFFELGYFIVIVTFVQIFIASFFLIILPLFKIKWKGKYKLDVILYFSGIGLGYMFVEIVFIQRFILYFGNAVYAASAVITSLLIFSGIGSNASARLAKGNRLRVIFSIIVMLLLLYSLLLTPVLRQTIHYPLFLKIFIVLILIAPLAVCMGMPFPQGLSRLSEINPELVPWSWGINGCVSVISTALATIVAVEMGFAWVMLFAAVAYTFALLAQWKWKI